MASPASSCTLPAATRLRTVTAGMFSRRISQILQAHKPIASQWPWLPYLGFRVEQDHRPAPSRCRDVAHGPDVALRLRVRQICAHVHEHVLPPVPASERHDRRDVPAGHGFLVRRWNHVRSPLHLLIFSSHANTNFAGMDLVPSTSSRATTRPRRTPSGRSSRAQSRPSRTSSRSTARPRSRSSSTPVSRTSRTSGPRARSTSRCSVSGTS